MNHKSETPLIFQIPFVSLSALTVRTGLTVVSMSCGVSALALAMKDSLMFTSKFSIALVIATDTFSFASLLICQLVL